MTTTATAAEQSFFIMMNITIILIAYAFLFVMYCWCPHPFQYLMFLFSFDQTKNAREMRHTHTHAGKMKSKRAEIFHKKSTEENETERHSSYGLHMRTTHMYSSKQTWGAQFISPCSCLFERFDARIKYITDFSIMFIVFLFLGLCLRKTRNKTTQSDFDRSIRFVWTRGCTVLSLSFRFACSLYTPTNTRDLSLFYLLALLIFSCALLVYFV